MDQFKNKVLCGTGHRPDKLGGYQDWVWDMLCNLALRVLTRLQPTQVISGMAQGWDQALAWAARAKEIPYIAAVPFLGFEERWPIASKKAYLSLLHSASQVVYVCDPGYAAWKMQTRNEWMVDHADAVVALWNGDRSGGTWNCVEYAWKVEKPVIQCWDAWQKRPTRTVHCKRSEYDVYIGRGKGGVIPEKPGEYGYFGNPIAKGKKCPVCGRTHKSGGSTLPCYRVWLETKIKSDPVYAAELRKLKGKVLGCWCNPNPCHGEVIAALLEGWEPYFTETITCPDCGGSGKWICGPITNGVPAKVDVCYRCAGKGKQTVEDQFRNHYYDLYYRRVD